MRGRWFNLGCYLVVLLAFALRVWGITVAPIWYDEAFSWYYAQQGVDHGLLGAIRGLLREDLVFPVHTVLLALWIALSGKAEFVLRFFGVLIGLPAIAIVGRWAKEMVHRRVGWGPMLVMSVLPLFIHYHQEVRWPALAVTLSALAGWQAWRVVGKGTNQAGYVLAMLVAMLAHSTVAFMWASLVVGGSIFLLASRKWGILRLWVLLNGVVALLFLPVVAWTFSQARTDATAPDTANLLDILRRLPIQFSDWGYLLSPWSIVLRMTLVVSVVTGMVVFATRRKWLCLSLVGTGLPLSLALHLGMAYVSGKGVPRYLLPSFGVWYVLAAGVGLAFSLSLFRLSFRWSLLGLALPGTTLVLALLSVAVKVAYVHGGEGLLTPYPDFRSVARYIQEHEIPGDAILVVAGPAALVMDYYYDGPAPIYGLPESYVFDLRHPLDMHAVDKVERIAASADRVWLALWWEYQTDPTSVVLNSLLDNCPRLGVGENFAHMSLLLFDTSACHPFQAWPSEEVNAWFNNGLQLVGYTLTRRPGEIILDVWWKAMYPIHDDYTTFVHLFRTLEQTPENLVAQDDRFLGSEFFPTSRWPSGTLLRTRHVLPVEGLDCRQCLLRIGIYNGGRRAYLVSFVPGSDAVELLISDAAVMHSE